MGNIETKNQCSYPECEVIHLPNQYCCIRHECESRVHTCQNIKEYMKIFCEDHSK